jgi:hypothetical protein
LRDIRINLGLPDHPKVQKLEKKCGPGAFKCLVRLWTFCAVSKPTGKLIGMSLGDIEMAARWEGEPGAFAAELLDIGWLDAEDEGYLSIHDWQEHQPWVFNSKERSEMARKAVQARWSKPRSGSKPRGGPNSMGLGCAVQGCDNPIEKHIDGIGYCGNPTHKHKPIGG